LPTEQEVIKGKYKVYTI